MKKTVFSAKFITLNAVIAALYVALTFITYQFSFLSIQFRPSEALVLLPFVLPQTIPGLFIGCMAANILSPLAFPADMIFGSLATLAAAIMTSKIKNKYIAAIPPVILNGLVIGLLLTIYWNDGNEAFAPLFAVNSLSVALSEALNLYTLGLGLLFVIDKTKILSKLGQGDNL